MGSFLLNFFTIILILICAVLVLLVMMQKTSSSNAMGGSLGGGAAESAFGADAGNILTRWTIYGAVAFFIICFCLYLGYMHQAASLTNKEGALPMLGSPINNEFSAGSLTAPEPAPLTETK